ncbi:MAG: ATP-binding cassette domain-containing protein, partial [Alphaproteobacteria bacterium]
MLAISVQGLGASLGGRVVLRDVSLGVAAGEMVALIGPSGAGKTTLLRAMAGLLPSSGKLMAQGQPALVF